MIFFLFFLQKLYLITTYTESCLKTLLRVLQILYPIGIPILIFSSMLYLDVPRLARFGKGEAIFEQMLGLYMKERDKTICFKIASIVGERRDEAAVAQRADELFQEVSCRGAEEVSVSRFFQWLGNVGIGGCDEEEVRLLFSHFDQDGDGELKHQEMLMLVRFLVKANVVVHPGLNIGNVTKEALAILSEYQWVHFVDGEDEQQGSEAVSSVFLRASSLSSVASERQGAEGVSSVFPRASNLSSVASDTSSRGSRSTLRQLPPSLQRDLDQTDPDEHDAIVDALLQNGQLMMRKGVFAVPRLGWRNDESSSEDEKALLDMIGFLLDAYHKGAWWWEVFEMWRKLMLAGVCLCVCLCVCVYVCMYVCMCVCAYTRTNTTHTYIHTHTTHTHHTHTPPLFLSLPPPHTMGRYSGAIILVPTEGGKQIGFAFLISNIWLHLTLYVPCSGCFYIHPVF